MKKTAVLLILAVGIAYFVSDSSSRNENKALSELEMELETKENLLGRMENDIEKIIAGARPKCKGGTVEVTVDKTPLIELREEIKTLKQKIAEF